MATLAEIRAKLQEQENRGPSGSTTGGGDNAIFAFWNIPENSTSVLRFLPDGDSSNTYFWRERQMIRLGFSGVKGDPNSRVAESSLQEDSTPENPIRRFIINPSIFNIIKGALMDSDFVELPTDIEQGTDFRLTKTTKGQYADYSTSSWSRKERSLDSNERAAIDQYGLFTLNDYLPKQPNEEELGVIAKMFEASVEGQVYDPELWGNYYRPAGVQIDTSNSAPKSSSPAPVAETPAPVTPPEKQEKVAEAVAATAPAPTPQGDDAKPSAQDILAAIRNRSN